MTKSNIIITLITVIVVLGGIVLIKNTTSKNTCDGSTGNLCNDSRSVSDTPSSNVIVVDGKQEITIIAGQGYSPKVTIAKANMPTTLKIQGKNAYGCESSIRIPQLAYAKTIDANGIEIIPIPDTKAGSTFNGTCSMGMYNFHIQFE